MRAIAKSHDIHQFLEGDSRTTFHNLSRLYDILIKFKYEGKHHLKKNLQETGMLLDFFQKEMKVHMRLEEKTLFPFITTHIPRLEPIVYLLLSEHEEFKRSLEGLKDCFLKMKRSKMYSSRMIDKITDQGSYFICLCRNHLWVESQSFYKVANRELRPGERRRLFSRIEKCSA